MREETRAWPHRLVKTSAELPDTQRGGEDDVTKTSIIAAYAIVIFAGGARARQPSPQDSTARIEIRVDGLACPMCAYGLEKKLKALPETDSVSVDLDNGIVALKLKPGTSVRDSELIQTVNDAGFAVRRIERERRTPPRARSGASSSAAAGAAASP